MYTGKEWIKLLWFGGILKIIIILLNLPWFWIASNLDYCSYPSPIEISNRVADLKKKKKKKKDFSSTYP